jgi:hypothetical protein
MQLALSYLSYFSGRVLHFSPVLASDCGPPTSGLLCLWDLRHMPPQLAFVWRQGLAYFCLGFPPHVIPPSLSSTSWDYRFETPHPASFLLFWLLCCSLNVPGTFLPHEHLGLMPSTCMCMVTFSCPVHLLKSNFLKKTYCFHSV